MKIQFLGLALLTIGFEVAYGDKLLTKLDKTVEPDVLEGTKGHGTWWLKRKVRRLIKAVEILEERLDNVNETNAAGIQNNADGIQTNTDSIQSNTGSIQTNAGGIQTNADGIQTNADGIQTSADSIQTNAGGIQTNTGSIQTNAGGIQTNADGIQTNADGIQTNAGGIQTNAGGIQTNAASIQTNAGGIQTNADNIQTNAGGMQTNADSIQTNIDGIQTNADGLLDLETMGPGSLWFDAWRTSDMETGTAAASWTTITYTDVRESSSNSGAMDVSTGVFTAPLAGTYQFILQAYKFPGTFCALRISRDGTTISRIDDNDQSNGATSGGTAIIEMQPGQKVWAMTAYKLQSWPTGESGLIHFTGVLITPK